VKEVELSVVIPAYNEERRLGTTLNRIVGYLRQRGDRFEVLVVDDGSEDRTAEVAEQFRGDLIEIVRLPENRGKGAALRRGVAASRGAWVLLCDADLSTPIEDLEVLEGRRNEGELILGSRAVDESRITRRQPLHRELMGKTFNRILRALALVDEHDTQCGFKLLRGDVARELFTQLTIEGFAFDVELVGLARDRGFRVVEQGVHWENSPSSRVDPVRDSLNMLMDVLRLRLRRWFAPSARRRGN
jgi:dolichyl-phosphate beta-glucosyltransferase